MTVAVTAGVMLLSSPAAFAMHDPSGYRHIHGTTHADHLHGTGHPDLLGAQRGDDTIRPGRGSDIIRAAGGDDRIFLWNDGVVDRIHCGSGFDVVSYHFSVDQRDIIDANCEGRVA
jgi:Ca2+-binding RTX toxin-like protein